MNEENLENDGFVFYGSFYHAIAEIDDPLARCEAYDALVSYAITGEVPDIKNSIARIVFTMARPQVDENNQRRVEG